ncbi:MAG: sensor histidine kinase [Thermomicrobia bacterium]|nr:sensor histidine kinase [Thermomicrobia bacterium]
MPIQQQVNNGATECGETGKMSVYEALSMDGRRGRAWRFIGLAWLFVLIGPINELLHTQQSPLRVGFGLVSAASFIVLYLWGLISDHERLIGRFSVWWIAYGILAIEAVALNLTFGMPWVGLFYFNSVGAGRAVPRIAIWLIAANSIMAGIVMVVLGASLANAALQIAQIGLIGIGMMGVFQMVRVNRTLRAAREENARLAVAEAVAKERLRFARELHDSVTQELFSMTLHARTTLKNLDRSGAPAADPVRQQVKILSDLAQAALAEMRMLIFELRPGALAEEGLVSAVRKLAASLSAREEIVIDVDAPADHLILETGAEEHLYRLVQEALNNVVKHASARRSVIRIEVVDGGTSLAITIRDDGKGFDSAIAYPGHMGLETMAARAKELGGDYAVVTAPGEGTTVRIAVPLDGLSHEPRRAASEAHPLLAR